MKKQEQDSIHKEKECSYKKPQIPKETNKHNNKWKYNKLSNVETTCKINVSQKVYKVELEVNQCEIII